MSAAAPRAAAARARRRRLPPSRGCEVVPPPTEPSHRRELERLGANEDVARVRILDHHRVVARRQRCVVPSERLARPKRRGAQPRHLRRRVRAAPPSGAFILSPKRGVAVGGDVRGRRSPSRNDEEFCALLGEARATLTAQAAAHDWYVGGGSGGSRRSVSSIHGGASGAGTSKLTLQCVRPLHTHAPS